MSLFTIDTEDAEELRDMCDAAAGYPFPCTDIHGNPNGRHTMHVAAITEDGVLLTSEVEREVASSNASGRMPPQALAALQASLATAVPKPPDTTPPVGATDNRGSGR